MCKPRPVWLRSKPDVPCEAWAEVCWFIIDSCSWPHAGSGPARGDFPRCGDAVEKLGEEGIFSLASVFCLCH